MRDPRDVIIRPIVTEKSYKLAKEENKYSFEVRLDATKTEVKQAVEKLFKVRVEKVNTLIVKPRPKQRFGRRPGRTKRWKKAIVTLAEGHKIDMFVAG